MRWRVGVAMEGDPELFRGQELQAVGELVTALVLDSNIVLLAGRNREHEFRIENDITVEDRTYGTRYVVRFDPYNRTDPVFEHLTELAAIIAARILHARVFMSGVLELILSNGMTLAVEPKQKYEAWTYTLGNEILNCPPGGFRS